MYLASETMWYRTYANWYFTDIDRHHMFYDVSTWSLRHEHSHVSLFTRVEYWCTPECDILGNMDDIEKRITKMYLTT